MQVFISFQLHLIYIDSLSFLRATKVVIEEDIAPIIIDPEDARVQAAEALTEEELAAAAANDPELAALLQQEADVHSHNRRSAFSPAHQSRQGSPGPSTGTPQGTQHNVEGSSSPDNIASASS